MQTFNVKDPGESVVLTYVMSNGLGAGETLLNQVSVTVSVLHGTDPLPNSILNGTPGLDATSTQALVSVTGGVNGTTYEISISVPTSNTKKTLVLSAALPVRAGV